MEKEKEGAMFDLFNKSGLCIVCRHEAASMHVEASPGLVIYVCETCIESAKHNFIWVCLNCGKAYVRSKALIINNIKDPALRRAYASCEDRQIVQGIDVCIECDPQGILKYMQPRAMVC
jgi:hypothetical protein